MSAVLDVLGERLPSIGLDELNARAALQTRVDSKYLVDLATFDAFVAGLAGWCDVLEVGGVRGQVYDTVYFDSERLRCYRDHLQRRRQTFKLRTRVYVGSGLHVFEVKMRDGRGHTVKRKTDHGDEAPDVIGADATTFYRRVVAEQYGFEVAETFAPSLRNRYARLTLASRRAEERTTVDFDLDLLSADGRLVGAMARDHVLIETKSAHGSGGSDRLLWSLGVRPSRVSKYCTGIALANPTLGAHRYARVLRGGFGWRPDDPGHPVDAVPALAPPVSTDDLPKAPRPPRPARAPRPPRPPR